MIAGFESITTGDIFIGGRRINDMPPDRRPTSTIFQNYALFPHMSVRRNVGYGLDVKGMPKAERDRKVDRMLATLGLDDIADAKPTRLSGGQRQRIALARGLVVEPEILLLDEPLGALDANLRRAIQAELKLLQVNLGITFIFVTHAQSEALTMSDRIVVMNNGRIEQVSTPRDLYTRPETRFVANFIGRNTILPGLLDAVDGAVGRVTTTLGTFTGAVDSAALSAGRSAAVVVPAEAFTMVPSRELRSGGADGQCARGPHREPQRRRAHRAVRSRRRGRPVGHAGRPSRPLRRGFRRRHPGACHLGRIESHNHSGRGALTPRRRQPGPFEAAYHQEGTPMAKEILCGFGVDVDAVAGWIGSYGGEDSPDDISRGLFAGEVGSPRLLNLFERLGIKTTWFIPGHSIETFPDQMKAVAEAGHEIGIHGYSHENPIAMTREQETEVLDRSIELVQKLSGKRPTGYVAPWWEFSTVTNELLLEHGIKYDHSLMHNDYQPYYVRVGDSWTTIDYSKTPKEWMKPLERGHETGLIEIPASWYLDDLPPMMFIKKAPNSHGFVNPARHRGDVAGPVRLGLSRI